jgi:hypothetical protein
VGLPSLLRQAFVFSPDLDKGHAHMTTVFALKNLRKDCSTATVADAQGMSASSPEYAMLRNEAMAAFGTHIGLRFFQSISLIVRAILRA